MRNIIHITEDEWVEKYNPSDELLETYGDEHKKILETDISFIWTLVETDGEPSIVSGFSFVNRIGFYISEVSHDIEDMIIVDCS